MKTRQRALRLLGLYLALCGTLAHLLVALLVVVFLADKFGDHWRVKQAERWLAGKVDDTQTYQLDVTQGGRYSYDTLPMGMWLKIHQQKSGDAVRFNRQTHSGSAWDSRRGRLLLFGSDTHGKNWDNSLYYFELEQLRWRQMYKPDSVESYRASNDGLPVAGSNRPWAMHTFDAINYHIRDDTLVVASYPAHMKPGRFGSWLQGIWPEVIKHPTWIYDFKIQSWRVAMGKPVHFFPHSSAYDTHRERVVGFRPGGVYEYHDDYQGWDKVAQSHIKGWHSQAVYDEKHRAFVVFGANTHSNNVYVYRAGNSELEQMPTLGLRPPGASSPPMAYNSKLGKVVALIDIRINGEDVAQTWLYDVGLDEWELATGGIFPFKLGMNYHMQYSKLDDVLVLLADVPPGLPSVWVLRL